MANLPTVDIDFEIFSEVSIGDVGLDNYINHPSTDIVCMAYSIGNDITRLWRPGREHKLPPRYILVAHNAGFEHAVILKFGSRYGIPVPEYVRCTAAKCAAMTLPRSLEGASKALKLPLVKDTTGKRIMLQVVKPRKPSKTNAQTNWFFNKDKMNTVYRYCIQDVDVEKLIDESTYTIHPSWEREVWEMDSAINRKGVPVDIDLAEAAVSMADKYVDRLNGHIRNITEGAVSSVNAVAQMKAFLNILGVEIDSLAKDVVLDLLEGELHPKAREILELRKNGSLTSVKKYKKIIAWTSADRNLRHLFMYYGAGTGRWTGKGPQLHNLPRGTYKGDKEEAISTIKSGDIEALHSLADAEELSPMDIISSCIRETFCAPEGKTFVCGDFSGIEVRVLAWLAGQEDLLELLRSGGDPYIDMASSIYGVEYDEVTSDQRSVGKMAVLGLGYGMGAEKFVDQCGKQGIMIDLEFAREIVRTYREKYSDVKSLWNRLEIGMTTCIRSGQAQVGPITMCLDDRKNIIMILPSGRPLYYIDCSMERGRFGKYQPAHYKVDSYTQQWAKRETYGGMLTENVVQAIARDILAQGMLRLHRVGHTPVLHVHDEAVLLVDESKAVEIEKAFTNAMLTRETWSEGIPLGVETWIGRRYHK
jgi:DNA polymerase bacteriophage-type